MAQHQTGGSCSGIAQSKKEYYGRLEVSCGRFFAISSMRVRLQLYGSFPILSQDRPNRRTKTNVSHQELAAGENIPSTQWLLTQSMPVPCHLIHPPVKAGWTLFCHVLSPFPEELERPGSSCGPPSHGAGRMHCTEPGALLDRTAMGSLRLVVVAAAARSPIHLALVNNRVGTVMSDNL